MSLWQVFNIDVKYLIIVNYPNWKCQAPAYLQSISNSYYSWQSLIYVLTCKVRWPWGHKWMCTADAAATAAVWIGKIDKLHCEFVACHLTYDGWKRVVYRICYATLPHEYGQKSLQGRSNNSRTLTFLGHLHVVLVFRCIRKCLLIYIYKYLQDIHPHII